MGWQQQMIVGILLLVCAFIFGRYIHNKPLENNSEFVASMATGTGSGQLPITSDLPNSDFLENDKVDAKSTRTTSPGGLQQSLRERILGKRLAAKKQNQPENKLASNSSYKLDNNQFEPGEATSLNRFKDELVQPDFSRLLTSESANVGRSSKRQQSESELPIQRGKELGPVIVGPLKAKPILGPESVAQADLTPGDESQRSPIVEPETPEEISVRPITDIITRAQSADDRELVSTKSRLTKVQQRTHRLSVVAKDYLTYVSKPGDTLHAISTKFYGKPDYYLDIYISNRDQLQNPSVIPEGLRLKIPVYSN